MSQTDGFRRYIEAGLALTQITRARAEELVRDLIRAGELEGGKAQDWVDEIVRVSRKRSDELLSAVRNEVRRQLEDLGLGNLEDFAKKVAEVIGRAVPRTARAPGTKMARGGRHTAARKAPAHKSTASGKGASSGRAASATAKKTAPTKKRAAAKKAPARKSTSARSRS